MGRQLLRNSVEEAFPIVKKIEQHWSDEGVTGALLGSMSRENLGQFLELHEHSDSDKKIDLMDQDVLRPPDRNTPLVQCNPKCITPDTAIQDVYLILKITGDQVVYVTFNNLIEGVVNWKELLGHKLN